MESNDHTLIIKTEYLHPDAIKEVMEERGNWKEHTDGTHVDFMHRDGKYLKDRSLEMIHSDISNITQKPKYGIYLKDDLYNIFMEYDKNLCKKYMMTQYNITLNNYKKVTAKIFSDKIWILKGVLSNSGKDIHILTNYNEYIKFFSEKQELFKWVLVEYIDNPLLIHNRKMHFRIYYLVHGNNAYYQKNPEIITAADPYIHGDYKNKRIHDTHRKSSIKDLFFPDGFDIYPINKQQYLRNQIEELFYHISQLLINLKCYDDAKECFEVFGIDLMVTDDFKIKLIEVNIKVSRRTDYKWSKMYLSGVFEVLCDKKYKPTKKIINTNFFTKVKSTGNLDENNFYHKYIKYKTKYLSEKN